MKKNRNWPINLKIIFLTMKKHTKTNLLYMYMYTIYLTLSPGNKTTNSLLPRPL